jgi:hypothetical protein
MTILRGLTSAPTIGDSADGDNRQPGRWESKDLTTMNHQNNLVYSTLYIKPIPVSSIVMVEVDSCSRDLLPVKHDFLFLGYIGQS